MATDISNATVKKSNVERESVSLYNEIDSSYLTWKNRTEFYYNTQDFTRTAALNHGFTTPRDMIKFMALKKRDFQKDELSEPTFSPESPCSDKLLSEEARILNKAMEQESAKELIQMFLDSYMSPVGSDISYRLGDVVGIKEFFYDPLGTVLHDDAEYYGQYDEYGRIDTTVNLRTAIYTPSYTTYWGWGTIFPSTTEYYVNWFFPPYNNDAFVSEGMSISDVAKLAQTAVKNRKWVRDYYTTDPETQKEVLVPGHWEYPDSTENIDLLDNITFDPSLMMSLRPNPTYRKAGFKAVNDNISLLQKVFENVSGVVSTYLTEWDISLYIQEGLIVDRQNRRPSILSICNRITKDNPSGYRDSAAYCYGVLNAAVSKTPTEGIAPHKVTWEPSCYPLSTYWIPYTSKNRGDGLDVFWNRALDGFNFEEYRKLDIKGKIKKYDELGAAFSGWYNWQDMRMWQALYTCSDDGIGPIDVVHLGMAPGETTWTKQGDIDGIINTVYDTICDNDSSIGWPSGEKEETFTRIENGQTITYIDTYVRDYKGEWQWSQRKRIDPNGDDSYVDKNFNPDDGTSGYKSSKEGDISILGVTIPGSSLLKMFLKAASIKDQVMNIANKAKKGGTPKATSSKTTPSSEKDSANSQANANGNSSEVDNGYISNTSGGSVNMLDVDEDEAGQTANQLGIPQWNPVLYGGPHGKCYSPNTLQGYFEPDNDFLRNIPRMNYSIDLNSENSNSFFQNNEAYYSPTGQLNNNGPMTARSPSKVLSLLSKGKVDFITVPLRCLQRHYTWRRSSSGIPYDWVYYYHRGSTVDWVYGYNTGLVVPYYSYFSYYYPWYRHSYWGGYYEWDEYYWPWRETRRYYKDYWGWYHNYCFWYGSYHLHGWCNGIYLLKYAKLETFYYWEYYIWITLYYRRALMHSDLNVKWNITKAYVNNYHTASYINDGWSGFFRANAFRRWMGWAPKYAVSYSQRETYRLSFPESGTYYYHYTGEGNNYRKSYEEQKFIENVLGNSTGATDWHDVFFCVCNDSRYDRMTYGPSSIIQYRVRLARYPYTAWHWNWYWASWSHRRRRRIRKRTCRHYYRVYYRCPHQYTGEFIEVDIASQNSMSFSGLNRTSGIWTNISSNRTQGARQEMYNDVPPENYRAYTASSPWADAVTPGGYLTVQEWPNRWYNWNEAGIYGWGYFTALPGLEPYIAEQSIFEDARNYISLTHMYGSGIRDCTIQSIVSKFKFWSIDAGARLATVGTTFDNGIIYPAYSAKAYSMIPVDNGFKRALETLYTSNTFYKMPDVSVPGELAKMVRPCLVYSDVPLRVAAKIALRQKSWLEYAKSLFLTLIDFDQANLLLEEAVDRDITISSDPAESIYNTESVYYHYWIEKASDLFRDPNGKENINKEFDRRISYLTSFLNDVRYLVGTTANSWSYNDYLTAYNYMGALYNNYSKQSTIIEEYLYSYLNVLYEYRKYFINKRCNKQDGTLWRMRQLEGIVPIVASGLYTKDINHEALSNLDSPSDIHQYKVAYYEVTNNNASKARALADESIFLEPDRTSVIYIKVEYVSQQEAQAYLDLVKSGEEKPNTQKIIWIQNKGWAKLPFDDTYIYLSKEFTKNKQNLAWNEKCDKANAPQRKRGANPDITDCVFEVNWDKYGALSLWNISNPTDSESAKRLSLRPVYSKPKDNSKPELISHYPYVYREVKGKPTITFDVVTGVNTTSPEVSNSMASSKKISTRNQMANDKDLSLACTGFEYSDFWRIVLPNKPLESYYKNDLKIKTYIRPDSVTTTEKGMSINPATGAFGYMLYPIIEEQTHDYMGMGIDMQPLTTSLLNLHNTEVLSE